MNVTLHSYLINYNPGTCDICYTKDIYIYIYIYIDLRKSRNCHWLFVCVWGEVDLWLCGVFIGSYAPLHLLILGSCYTAHRCIVKIMKVYIKMNNIQVELIRFRKE